MINLLNAEIASLRYRSRTAAAIIALMLLGLLLPTSWMGNARPLNDLEIKQGELAFQESRASCPDCDPTQFMRQVWSFNEVVINGIQPFISLIALVVLVIVLFYVGSDFASGALWTRLTFTPRRTPVLMARVLVSGLLGALMMALAVVTTVIVSAIWFVALNGFDQLDSNGRLLVLVMSAVLYGAIMGIIGALATFLMNGTIAGGALLLSFIVLSLVAEIFVFARPRLLTLLSPLRQQDALLSGSTMVWGPMGDEVMSSRPGAILYHLIVMGIMFAVTIPVFRRRDLKF